MHNFLNLRTKTDNFKKGVFSDPYDEPTYLTFAIDFNFEATHFAEIEGPDYFLHASPLFKNAKGEANDDPNSAQNFLIKRGYVPQANALKTFKEILKYLTFNAPWYFNSVNGLNTLWKNATDTKSGSKSMKNPARIEINTLEAVDLRLTEIADLYRNSVYDKFYMRERVPDNLRWFNMDIYIAEFRNIRYRLPGVAQGVAQFAGVNTAALSNLVGSGNQVSNVMDQYGYIKFKCSMCEFDFSDSLPTVNAVGGGRADMATNKFAINIGFYEEENSFGDGTKTFDRPSKTAVQNPWGNRNIGTGVENIGTFMSGFAPIGNALNTATAAAQQAASNIGGFINPALAAAANFVGTGSFGGVTSLGDAYESGYSTNGDNVPPRQSPPSGNVYPNP